MANKRLIMPTPGQISDMQAILSLLKEAKEAAVVNTPPATRAFKVMQALSSVVPDVVLPKQLRAKQQSPSTEKRNAAKKRLIQLFEQKLSVRDKAALFAVPYTFDRPFSSEEQRDVDRYAQPSLRVLQEAMEQGRAHVSREKPVVMPEETGDTLLHCMAALPGISNEEFKEFFEKVDVSSANFNVINALGDTPLITAVKNNNLQMVQFLLIYYQRMDVDVRNDLGMTAAHYALGHNEILSLLLDKGANVNARNALGETPLHMAVKSGLLNSVKLLHYHKADLNAQADERKTPLHLAVEKKDNIKMVQWLCVNGANLDIVDSAGRTPWQAANFSTDPKLEVALRALLQPGATAVLVKQKSGTAQVAGQGSPDPLIQRRLN